jgi:tetratricopeptide (TPR) repeat protein
MRTKEIAFTIPLLVVLYEVFFFHGGKGWKKKLPYLLPLLLTLLVIPLDMVNARVPFGELLSDVSEATRVQTDVSRWEYLITQFRVIATYIRLLFLPVNQNLDYDYPIYRSILEPSVTLSFLFLLGLFTTAIVLFRKARKGSDPACLLIAFGILWFFISLSVESSVIPIVDLIYEHRVYLPSTGAFLAVGSAFTMVSRVLFHGHYQKILAFVAIVSIAILSTATYRRNLDWRDPVTFWADVASKSPGKVRPYNNLGASLADANRGEEAIEVFLKAIRVKPDRAGAKRGPVRILRENCEIFVDGCGPSGT